MNELTSWAWSLFMFVFTTNFFVFVFTRFEKKTLLNELWMFLWRVDQHSSLVVPNFRTTQVRNENLKVLTNLWSLSFARSKGMANLKEGWNFSQTWRTSIFEITFCEKLFFGCSNVTFPIDNNLRYAAHLANFCQHKTFLFALIQLVAEFLRTIPWEFSGFGFCLQKI